MKRITAIIRSEKLDSVKTALKSAGNFGITVSNVRGLGQSEPQTLSHRGLTYVIDLADRIEFTTIVDDSDKQTVIDCILKEAKTGSSGDGIILVSPIEETYNITNGQSGL